MQPFGLSTPEACKNTSPGYAFFAYPGLISMQPFGLATPEACKNISPGYAFFAYPG